MALTYYHVRFSFHPSLPCHLASGLLSQLPLVKCTAAVSVKMWGPCPLRLSSRMTRLSCVAEHPANPSLHVSSSPQTTCSSKRWMFSPIRVVQTWCGNETNADGSFYDVYATHGILVQFFLERSGVMTMHEFPHINLISCPSLSPSHSACALNMHVSRDGGA